MSRLSTFDYSFGSNKISQSWNDLFIWELILNEYPPVRVLELGTFTGGMAGYLYVQSILRDAQFRTFDLHSLEHLRNERKDSFFHSSIKLPFTQLDIRNSPGIETIGELIRSEGRTVVFCDNGYKEEEARIYTPYLKQKDILAVHDWGTECHSVPEELTLITPIEGIYEELESMTRFFINDN